jgi:hypothetical protein
MDRFETPERDASSCCDQFMARRAQALSIRREDASRQEADQGHSRRYVIEHLNHINQDEVIIQHLEDWINSIHRESLNGETAHAYDSRLAQAA